MNPFFSIVVPTFNRSYLIGTTIDSVLEQDYTDFELLIIDDGSTDDTKQMIQKVYANEPRIRIISQPNAERGAARNNGIRNSTGKYICFLDSDDKMLDDHLSVLKEAIVKNDYPDFISTKFYLARNGKNYPGDIVGLKEGFYDYHIFLNGNPLACNICVKRENPDLKYFVEDRSFSIKEDWLFLLQNLRHHHLFLVDKITILMEDHDERSMRKDDQLIIEKTKKAYKWINDNIQLPNHEDEILRAHVHFFIAVHSYLDGERKPAISNVIKAIRLRGIKRKYIFLLIKSFIGRKLIRLIYSVKH